MISRYTLDNSFEFVIVSALRARQLQRGALARVPRGDHKGIVTAQQEVLTGMVAKVEDPPPVPGQPGPGRAGRPAA